MDVKAMTLRLPAELAEEVRMVAEIDGVSVNAAVVRAVEVDVAARRSKREFQERLLWMEGRNRAVLDRLA